MKRRDVLKAFSLTGAFLAASQTGRGQREAPDDHAFAAGVEDGHSSPWPHWPFDEIRIPYRERAGKIKWPNNGPLCVYMYVTGEWRGHQTLSDPQARYKRDLRGESATGQYEYTVGIWRAIKLLDKFGIKVSFFPTAGMVEKYPDLFRELTSKGHEIISRPYGGVPTTRLTPSEERKEIQICTAVIEKATGQRPIGFDNPGGVCTDKTPEILADEGYLWMGGLKGDDLPYGIRTRNQKKIVVVGSRHTTTNDYAIFETRGLRSAKDAFEFFKDSFDAYYKLGKEEFPGAFNYGIHPQHSCIPDRIGFQERALDYMLQFQDVWFARWGDLAEYWMKNYMDV